jgi:ABC-type antimicrobial peptide transport system permease subunit
MNPLSPFTYYRRHKRRALMLISLLALAVTGIYLLVGLMQETFVTPPRTINQYLSKFSLVQSDRANTLDPAVTAQIRAHPDVAQVLPQSSMEMAVPNAGGVATPFRLIGLYEADVATVLAHSGVTLVEGQLPQPRTNGVALSWETAMALDLEIGDTFDWSKDEYAYPSIVSPLELVGILSGDVRLGIVSYEYLEGHERYRDIASYGALVIARAGSEAAVDDFLTQTIRNSRTDVYTHQLLLEEVTRNQMLLVMTFSPIVLLVTAAITLVIGTVNRLAFLQRLPEFGTLHAVGRSKRWLARRLTLETAGLAIAGWALGILVSLGGMVAMSAAFYAPQGYGFDPIQGSALLLVTPLPLAVVGSTIFTATRTLGRMDAVAIVERGELSLEEAQPGSKRSGYTERGRAERLPRPLASATFYRRHTSQAAVLIGAMALMIVGTALFVFILEASTDVMLQPPLTPLEPMSLVSQKGVPLDTAVIAQIRAHPAVERTIPAYVFSPLDISIPPMIPNFPVEAYGVTAEDMAYLVELYGLELAEGHLPRPNTNEIVISEALARNRGLHVGDSVGRPVYERDLIPTEMTIVGLFATDGMWMGFASLEYVQSHELTSEFPARLLVAPVAGRKEALDARLMADVDSTETVVQTYDGRWREFQQHRRGLLGLFGVVESLIAVIAAVALAVLDYIFFSQRREEFGLLHAVGHGQGWLTWRAGRETLSVVGAAWLIGAVVCVGMMLYAQFGIYAPKGMSINSTSVAPWLFTLPIPLAVVGASAGTIAWALSRLDPVAIIERR